MAQASPDGAEESGLPCSDVEVVPSVDDDWSMCGELAPSIVDGWPMLSFGDLKAQQQFSSGLRPSTARATSRLVGPARPAQQAQPHVEGPGQGLEHAESGSSNPFPKGLGGGCFVFLCSDETESECLNGSVFGLPKSSFGQIQACVTPDTLLFLHNMQSKRIMGIYKATGPPGLDLVPGAFQGRFGAQVYVKQVLPSLLNPVMRGIKFGPQSRAQLDQMVACLGLYGHFPSPISPRCSNEPLKDCTPAAPATSVPLYARHQQHVGPSVSRLAGMAQMPSTPPGFESKRESSVLSSVFGAPIGHSSEVDAKIDEPLQITPCTQALDLQEDDSDSCVICQVGQKTHAMIPCGHMCICYKCVDHFPAGAQCPMCRAGIICNPTRIYTS